MLDLDPDNQPNRPLRLARSLARIGLSTSTDISNHMLSLDARDNTKVGGSFSGYFNDIFVKKRKLVKLELDFVNQVKSEWQTILGDKNNDRAKAENTIKACYRCAGLNAPSIVWADHPIAAIKILLNSNDLVNVSGVITNHLWNESEVIIQQTIDPESTANVLANISPSYSIRTPKGIREVTGIADRLNDVVMKQISDLYLDLAAATIPMPLQDYRIADLSYFDYFLRIGLKIPEIQLPIDLAKSCGWCWTFSNLAILAPKPSKIKINRQGKIVAIIYGDVDIIE
jgi:hypothetical protein